MVFHCVNNEDKFRSPETIDKVVFADILNPTTNPRLYEIVTSCVIHGPCGSLNPKDALIHSPALEEFFIFF